MIDYEILERTQGGSYRPERSAREWIEFCVEAPDLRRLLDTGLIEQQGRGRSSRYSASDTLRREIMDAGPDSSAG